MGKTVMLEGQKEGMEVVIAHIRDPKLRRLVETAANQQAPIKQRIDLISPLSA